MNHPINLTTLPPREAIVDALYRAIIGLDTNNYALFESAWIDRQDVVFEMDGNAMNGLDVIEENIFKNIGPLDTTHFLTNIRIEAKDGADSATVTTYALAQHYKAGEGKVPDTKRLLSGSMYSVDVVKDKGTDLWKIKTWNMKIVWTEGDMSIVMK